MAEYKTEQEIEKILARYPKKQGAILPLLRVFEREKGSISKDEISRIAEILGVSPAMVLGTKSFYTRFKDPTYGKYVIQICCTLPCALRGSLELYEYISKKLGIKDGETTKDGLFTLKKVECLAACDKAPFIQINDEDYSEVTPEKIDNIIEKLKR